jgi:hypothetical protein
MTQLVGLAGEVRGFRGPEDGARGVVLYSGVWYQQSISPASTAPSVTSIHGPFMINKGSIWTWMPMTE